MPEGDSVHKVGLVIRRELQGKTFILSYLQGLPAHRLAEFRGVAVSGVEMLGKHLLLHFANGWIVRVHLGMHGRWEKVMGPRSRRRDTQVVLQGPEARLVCVGPKDAELIPPGQRERHPVLASLGPDLLGEAIDYDEVLQRAGRICSPDVALADLLVEQRVASGLGNVYRNELCFLGAYKRIGNLRPGPRLSSLPPLEHDSAGRINGPVSAGARTLAGQSGRLAPHHHL